MPTANQTTTIRMPGFANLVNGPAQAIIAWRAAMALPVVLAVEGLRFAGRRALAQADHLAELAQCQNLAAAVYAQSRFAQATGADYQAQAEVLARKIQASASSTDTPA